MKDAKGSAKKASDLLFGLVNPRGATDEPTPEEVEFVRAKISAGIRTRNPDMVKRALDEHGFVPRPRRLPDADHLAGSLLEQAAIEGEAESFLMLARVACDDWFLERERFCESGSSPGAVFLKSFMATSWVDASAKAWGRDTVVEAGRSNSPLAACFAHDAVECLAALLDDDFFGPGLLADEPKPMGEGDKDQRRFGREDAKVLNRCLLFHTIKSNSGRCAALLCRSKGFCEGFLSDKLGLWGANSMSFRSPQQVFEETDDPLPSGFEMLAVAADRASSHTSWREDEEGSVDAFAGFMAAIDAATDAAAGTLGFPPPQEGAGMGWIEMAAAHMFSGNSHETMRGRMAIRAVAKLAAAGQPTAGAVDAAGMIGGGALKAALSEAILEESIRQKPRAPTRMGL